MSDFVIRGIEIRNGGWAALVDIIKARLPLRRSVTTCQDIYDLLSTRRELIEDSLNRAPLPAVYCKCGYELLGVYDEAIMCVSCHRKYITEWRSSSKPFIDQEEEQS